MNAEDDRADRKYSKDTLRQQEGKKNFSDKTPLRPPDPSKKGVIQKKNAILRFLVVHQ